MTSRLRALSRHLFFGPIEPSRNALRSGKAPGRVLRRRVYLFIDLIPARLFFARLHQAIEAFRGDDHFFDFLARHILNKVAVGFVLDLMTRKEQGLNSQNHRQDEKVVADRKSCALFHFRQSPMGPGD